MVSEEGGRGSTGAARMSARRGRGGYIFRGRNSHQDLHRRGLLHTFRPVIGASESTIMWIGSCSSRGQTGIRDRALSGVLTLSCKTKGPGEEWGPQKSSRNFGSESGRFRVQISLWLLWKEQSTICTILALFGRRILGQYPAAPSSPAPFVLLLILLVFAATSSE